MMPYFSIKYLDCYKQLKSGIKIKVREYIKAGRYNLLMKQISIPMIQKLNPPCKTLCWNP